MVLQDRPGTPTFFLAAILAAIFLRNVGIVGHKNNRADAESDKTVAAEPGTPQIMSEKPTPLQSVQSIV